MIPILIFHTGKTYYLRYVIEQARLFNPQNSIYLVSDETTEELTRGICFHELMSNYHKYVDEFLRIYKHHSTCSVQFETFCFSRWFVMREFMEKHHIERAVSIDSDFLLFDSIDNIFSSDFSYEYNVCGQGCSPHCTIFSIDSIKKFCNFIMKMYREGDLNQKVVDEFNVKHAAGVEGGICDMTAFRWYEQLHPGASINMAIPRDGKAIDDSLYSPSGYEVDLNNKMPFKNKVAKRIIWENNIPYGIWSETGEKVQFLGIHLQGAAKLKMCNFLLNSKKQRRGILFAIKWYLNPEIIKFIYKTLKKNQRLIINKIVWQR